MKFDTVRLGELLELLTDYHANGAYKKLKENVELLDEPDYAVMIRTTNFEQNEFSSNLKYITENAYNFLAKSKVQAGDIIMNKIANAGSSYLMPKLDRPASLAMNLFLLRIDPEKANPTYVYIYLKVHEAYVKNFANGSVTKTITKEAVRNLEVKLPDRAIQDSIVDIYFSLSDKIELNRQTNQILEQIAESLFKSWFVDFEPTRAKIAANQAAQMRQQGQSDSEILSKIQQDPCWTSAQAAIISQGNPEQAAIAALNGGQAFDTLSEAQQAQLKTTAALFPDTLVDSEQEKIPEGWSIESIYNIADVIYGAPFKSKLFNEDGKGLPLVRIRDLKKERPGVYTPEVHKKGYLIKNGDLLVGMDGEFRPYIWGGNEAWMNQRVCTFKPKKGISSVLVREFITRQLRFFELTAVATTVIHLGKGDIDGFTYLEPNNDLLEAFSKNLEPIFKRIVANKVQCINLEEMRDALLPKLLSGDL
ncbi:restriction endonuclease subunit S [Microbulbifer sp. TRSA007]|uniref:restriction endonuclease subunit S n=1 Tax=Microbulbifer sp. TRSA007 TaxID=3243384 RepID=UPI00403A7856